MAAVDQHVRRHALAGVVASSKRSTDFVTRWWRSDVSLSSPPTYALSRWREITHRAAAGKSPESDSSSQLSTCSFYLCTHHQRDTRRGGHSTAYKAKGHAPTSSEVLISHTQAVVVKTALKPAHRRCTDRKDAGPRLDIKPTGCSGILRDQCKYGIEQRAGRDQSQAVWVEWWVVIWRRTNSQFSQKQSRNRSSNSSWNSFRTSWF